MNSDHKTVTQLPTCVQSTSRLRELETWSDNSIHRSGCSLSQLMCYKILSGSLCVFRR